MEQLLAAAIAIVGLAFICWTIGFVSVNAMRAFRR